MKSYVLGCLALAAVAVGSVAAYEPAQASPLVPACGNGTGLVVMQAGAAPYTRCAAPGVDIAGGVSTSSAVIVNVGIKVSRDAPRSCRLFIREGSRMTPAGAPIRPNTFGVRSFPPSKMVKQYKLVC